MKLSFPAIYYAGSGFWLHSLLKEKLPQKTAAADWRIYYQSFVVRYVHIVAQAVGKINIYDNIVTAGGKIVIFLLLFALFL